MRSVILPSAASHDHAASPAADDGELDRRRGPEARNESGDGQTSASEAAIDAAAGPDPALHLPILDESIEARAEHESEASGSAAPTPAPAAELRPSWRGWIHAGTFPVALAAGIVLIVLADGGLAKFGATLYAVGSWLLFGISGLYHRFNWSPKVKIALKRFDHANIFLLIAGTYSPISLLALPPEKGWVLFGVVWGVALLGIAFRVFWVTAPRWLYVSLYIALGWAAVMFIVDLFQANPATMILVVAGGLLYTVGAVVYGAKWPNPSPRHFGFHEIFHIFTVLAFLAHWAGVLLICLWPLATAR